MRSAFASPGSDYLARLGELVYAVGSLEWLLVGDVSQHRAALPPTLTVEALAGKTTTGLANAFNAAMPAITDPDVAAFYAAGGAALAVVAELRNPVLHARPATMPDGSQRLYRWRTGTQAGPAQSAGPGPACDSSVLFATRITVVLPRRGRARMRFGVPAPP